MGLPLPWSDGELAGAITDTVEANTLAEATIRLTLSRGVPEHRGLLPPPSPRPTLVIQAMPFTAYPAERYRVGFVAITASIRRNEASPLSNIKSSNYLDNILARMEAEQAGADDALLLNTKGELACATASNLFLVIDGRLVTPALRSGVLPGITRCAVIELGAKLGLPCEERPVAQKELMEAQEAFLTNTLMGVMPLVRVDEEDIGGGAPGEVARLLQNAYLSLVEAELG